MKRLFFALPLAIVAACSPSKSTTNGNATDIATAYCNVIARCDSMYFTYWFNSSIAACQPVAQSMIGYAYSLPGVTQDEINTVINTLNTGSCTSSMNLTPTGSLANGTSCIQNIQC
jgi:hypothetical protein